MRNKPDLLKFQRPGRYLGKEWDLNYSKPASKDLRVCLCYPHYYETGMSNLGFRIIYQLLNTIEGVNCERCFLPQKDMRDYLIENKKPLFSLETGTALNEFDLIGFSINYELNFINLLTMLQLGAIPINSEKRNKPLVIIGGLSNPEPIAKFIDICFLGEFENKANRLMQILRKTRNLSKPDILTSLAEVEGVYIPEMYSLDNHRLKPKGKNAPYPLKRAFVKDLNESYYPQTWPIPFIPIIFDRAQVEIQRGCPNACKFCQARCIYRPYRQRKPDLIINSVKKLSQQTGYETISLSGLSVIDYTELTYVLDEVIPYLKKKRIGISIPSIRPTKGAEDILKKILYTKKPGLTLALESASAPLRRSIGKNVDMRDCKELVKCAAGLGYKKLKFYFMIGLPGETEADVLNICDILKELSCIFKQVKGHMPQINVAVSYFLPKPFSGFQTHTMESKSSLLKKKRLLKNRLFKKRNIKLNFPWYEQSLLENILSRADRRIAPVLESALHKTFTNPDNASEFGLWHDLSKKEGVDLDLFTQTAHTLPSHIIG